MIPSYAPSLPDWMRTVAGQLNPLLGTAIYAQGDRTVTAGSLMGFDWIRNEQSIVDPAALGGLWSGKTRAHDLDAYAFESGEGDANSPLFHKLLVTVNDGAAGDVVGVGQVLKATASNSVLFSGNTILWVPTGITDTKVVGPELDVLLSGADTAPGSILLVANVFNYASSMTLFQAGGVSGGSWGNGFVTGSITGSHYAVQSGDPVTAASFINTANGTFSNTAIVLGKGISQGVAFGSGGGGTSPYLYSDSSNNLTAQLGSTDVLNISSHAGSAVFALNASTKTLSISGAQILSTRFTKPGSPALSDVVACLDHHGLWG